MKVFTPTSFKKPSAESLRETLITLFNDTVEDKKYQIEYGTNDSIKLIVKVDAPAIIETQHLIDFCDFYSKTGKWKSMTSSRKPSSSIVTFTLEN